MLFALCIGFAAALLSFAAPFMLIPAAAVICAVGFAWGTGYAAVAAVFVCFGILGTNISEPTGTLFTLLPFLAASAALTAGLKRKTPYRLLAALLSVFALISLYGLICVPQLLKGEAPYSGIIGALKEFETLYNQTTGLDIADFSDMISIVSTVFYGYLIFLAEFIGFSTVVLTKFFCSACKAKPRSMAKFADWQLPQSLRFGIPILAGGCVIAYTVGFKGAETLLFAVFGLILPPLTAQGAAVTMFALSRGRAKGRPHVFYLIIVIFLILFSPFVFALFGLIELYAHSRERFRKYDKKIREAFERAEKTGSSSVIVDLDDGEGPRIIAVRKKNDGAYYDRDTAVEPNNAEDDEEKGKESEGTDAKENHNGHSEAESEKNAADTSNADDLGSMDNKADTGNAGDSGSTDNKADTGNTDDSEK